MRIIGNLNQQHIEVIQHVNNIQSITRSRWHVPRSIALLKCNVIYLIKTAPDDSNTYQAQFIQILTTSITVF